MLIDVQIPVMDGLEATRLIRADPELSGVRIIAMTGNVDQESKQLCLDAGMSDFIAKPIDTDLLISTLLKWLKPESALIQQLHSIETTGVSMMMDADSLIDPAVLARSLGQNDPVQMHKYFVLFVESTKESMKEVEIALVNADLTMIAALGHRIKSAALTVGAMSFAELCKDLESFKNGGEIERARKILQQMQLLMESIEKQLDINLI